MAGYINHSRMYYQQDMTYPPPMNSYDIEYHQPSNNHYVRFDGPGVNHMPSYFYENNPNYSIPPTYVSPTQPYSRSSSFNGSNVGCLFPDSQEKLVRSKYSYASIIAMAIKESPMMKLTLHQIYTYVTDKFPFYRTTKSSWQNSIRHCLSLNDCFISVPREEHDPGRGSYWTLNPNCEEMFRKFPLMKRRKRRESNTTKAVTSKGNEDGTDLGRTPSVQETDICSSDDLKNLPTGIPPTPSLDPSSMIIDDLSDPSSLHLGRIDEFCEMIRLRLINLDSPL